MRLALAVLLALGLAPSRSEAAPVVHASASCAPAAKPGRIRCRAVLELPLDATGKERLSWGELLIVSGAPSITPLRGRLGPLDAEVREDGRIVWSFSVAAADVGEHSFDVRLIATLETQAKTKTLVEQRLTVQARVSP